MPADSLIPTVTDLRSFLAQKLPDVMIPTAYVPLEQMPLTPNGKIDRSKLPAIGEQPTIGTETEYHPPRTRTEEILCRIWQEILNVPQVGIHDNFFDLGGHSLLLTPLAMQLRSYFQIRVSMREFFERATVAELAEMVESVRAQQATSPNGGDLFARQAQHGHSAKERFDFLRQEAELDPNIQPANSPYQPRPLRRLLMTGATGFVGAYMVHYFMEQTDILLDCLVRAKDVPAGLDRIRKQCQSLGLWDEKYAERINPVLGDISQPKLGLSPTNYEQISLHVDAILHSAAIVNFIYPYQTLKKVNVDGVKEMIKLAFAGNIQPIHYVSTTAVWPMGAHRTFLEGDDLDHDMLLNLPYDESKWVAEKMLRQAEERGLPLIVHRPGEVSGDSKTGYADLSHLASALLKGSLQLG